MKLMTNDDTLLDSWFKATHGVGLTFGGSIAMDNAFWAWIMECLSLQILQDCSGHVS